MGWRERDYARFTTKEWNSYTGQGETTSRPSSARGPSRSFRPQHAGSSLFAAVAVSAAASVFFGWSHITSFLRSPVTHFSASGSNLTVPGPPGASKVIGIRWSTTDLAPAAQAGRICVTAAAHGRICASYVVGERPADTLTRRIESLGLQVESNG